MGFSAKQVRALQRPLQAGHIRTRQANGRELSFIEGWHAIAEANRIFGFGGWDRETVESRCVFSRETRGTFVAVYIAKVRVTVRATSETVVREGHGTGEGRGNTPGETHDLGLKAAETDATKRALATFGRPFGLALYLSAKGARTQVLRPDSGRPVRAGNGTNDNSEPISEPGVPAPQLPLPKADAPALKGALHFQEGRGGPLPSYPRRHRDKEHLKFVAAQPCLLCGRLPADAHHLRFAQPRALGLKVSDEFVVPLCRGHHRQVHQSGNEAAWWNDLEIDALEIADSLWQESHGVQSTVRGDLTEAIQAEIVAAAPNDIRNARGS
jgi:hypothetical protein